MIKMDKNKCYFICNKCSAHSLYPFKECPSCSSKSIRASWEEFQNEFIPIVKIFMEANELYCPFCYPEYNRLALVATQKKQFGYPDKYYACSFCGYGVKTTELFGRINTIYDPSYRCSGKEILISIQEIGGKRLVIGKKI